MTIPGGTIYWHLWRRRAWTDRWRQYLEKFPALCPPGAFRPKIGELPTANEHTKIEYTKRTVTFDSFLGFLIRVQFVRQRYVVWCGKLHVFGRVQLGCRLIWTHCDLIYNVWRVKVDAQESAIAESSENPLIMQVENYDMENLHHQRSKQRKRNKSSTFVEIKLNSSANSILFQFHTIQNGLFFSYSCEDCTFLDTCSR